MAVDTGGRLFGWGEGEKGCLGLGDGKSRIFPVTISFFEDKRVVDVACGERFTVVVAELYSNINMNAD
jgi:alpha-tubulin suppressor-like RCC1 family protein